VRNKPSPMERKLGASLAQPYGLEHKKKSGHREFFFLTSPFIEPIRS
jgi:hypothetical protein